jgi:hypothetical protein
MERIKDGGGDGGEPVRSPLGRLNMVGRLVWGARLLPTRPNVSAMTIRTGNGIGRAPFALGVALLLGA